MLQSEDVHIVDLHDTMCRLIEMIIAMYIPVPKLIEMIIAMYIPVPKLIEMIIAMYIPVPKLKACSVTDIPHNDRKIHNSDIQLNIGCKAKVLLTSLEEELPAKDIHEICR